MIFLPIKPKYALAIKDLRKTMEFRKVRFKNKSFDSCLVYASSPLKKIIGYFKFSSIDEGHPKEIWRKYRKVGCISKADFDTYYQYSKRAYAIKIDHFLSFGEPIDPFQKIAGFKIPQSYKYLSEEEFKALV